MGKGPDWEGVFFFLGVSVFISIFGRGHHSTAGLGFLLFFFFFSSSLPFPLCSRMGEAFIPVIYLTSRQAKDGGAVFFWFGILHISEFRSISSTGSHRAQEHLDA